MQTHVQRDDLEEGNLNDMQSKLSKFNLYYELDKTNREFKSSIKASLKNSLKIRILLLQVRLPR